MRASACKHDSNAFLKFNAKDEGQGAVHAALVEWLTS